MYIAPPFSQIKDRITHQLTGPMISHIPAPIGFKKLDSGALQNVRAGKQVVLVCRCDPS